MRKYLSDYLSTHKSIQSGLIVKSSLVDKLEVVGFIAAKKGTINFNDLLAVYNKGYIRIGGYCSK